MDKPVCTLIVLFLVLSVGGARSQDLNEILGKHFKAVGQDKLAKSETCIIKANVTQMGREIPMVMKMKGTGKFRMEMDIMGQKMIQAYNGEKGWVVAPWISSKPQELAGAELDQAMAQKGNFTITGKKATRLN